MEPQIVKMGLVTSLLLYDKIVGVRTTGKWYSYAIERDRRWKLNQVNQISNDWRIKKEKIPGWTAESTENIIDITERISDLQIT